MNIWCYKKKFLNNVNCVELLNVSMFNPKIKKKKNHFFMKDFRS